jgi:UDP-glucose 4-epimerase
LNVSLEEGIRRMAVWATEAGARSSKPFADVEVRRNLPPSWRRLLPTNLNAPAAN